MNKDVSFFAFNYRSLSSYSSVFFFFVSSLMFKILHKTMEELVNSGQKKS